MLEVRGLKKTFKRNLLFDNVNLKMNKGNIYGFVGPNGCGKSVFFKILCGFLKADSGEVIIDGKIIGKDIDFLPSMGVLIESPGFIENYTHIKNLQYLAAINNVISKDDIINNIRKVGLDENLSIKVNRFSLGMRQRLGIAQAIMEKPDILVLDEPFNGLDKNGVKEIKNVLYEYKKQDKIILMTSHISQDIDEMADTVYEFNNYTIENS